MMSLSSTPPLPLLFLLMVSGVVSQEWGVDYSPKSISTVKGSTVIMGCSYTYPAGYRVQRAFWSREFAQGREPPDLSLDPKYSGRVQYLGDNLSDCSLRLSDVTEEDGGKYYFRFITTTAGGKYQGADGVGLSVTGVVSQEWGVNYSPSSICAIKGSTVIMGCSYTYPAGYRVQRAFWSREFAQGREPPDLSLDPKYSGRVQYLGDNLSDCSLRLSDVTEDDGGKYYFRFITTTAGGKYEGASGLDLSIPEIQVMIPDQVIEGDEVTLTCKTSISRVWLSGSRTFVWYRNGSRLSSSDMLHLPSVSQGDAGRYSCALRNRQSCDVPLDVQYPPKSISVSISPSGEIVEGSSVTLTCSSDSNPPVQSYTWYKGGSSIGTGNIYTISRIRSEDSGHYTCQALNKHGHQSSTVSLNVLYPPKRVSVSISHSGEIVEGSSVTLTCSSDSNPPVQSYTWYKGGSSIGTGNTYTISRIRSEDSGDYMCQALNKHGHQSSTVSLNVLYPPKRVSVSISPSGEIVEGSSVTLNCSSDSNPPVQNYTWYKVNESSPVGSGQSYSFMFSSNSSGWFYCVAQNKYGTQSAAAVPLTLNGGRSVVLYVALGVTAGCGCLFAIICVLCMRRKRRGGSADNAKSSQKVSSSPPEDTYTALDLQTRSSNDVYQTLAMVHSSPPDDTYTSLDSQSISPDYCNLPVRREQF